MPPRPAFSGRGGWFGGAGPGFRPNNARCAGAGEVEVYFPLPGRFGESRPMRLVKHRDGATSPPHRLVTSDLLHLQPLEGSRNVVLSDVVRRGLLEKIVEHVLCQPRR